MSTALWVEGLFALILLSIIASRLKDIQDMMRCEHLKRSESLQDECKVEFDDGRCDEHSEGSERL